MSFRALETLTDLPGKARAVKTVSALKLILPCRLQTARVGASGHLSGGGRWRLKRHGQTITAVSSTRRSDLWLATKSPRNVAGHLTPDLARAWRVHARTGAWDLRWRSVGPSQTRCDLRDFLVVLADQSRTQISTQMRAKNSDRVKCNFQRIQN